MFLPVCTWGECLVNLWSTRRINGLNYRVENIIKQLVHESAVRSPRYEALGKLIWRALKKLRIFRALQTSRVLHIWTNAHWRMNQLLIRLHQRRMLHLNDVIRRQNRTANETPNSISSHWSHIRPLVLRVNTNFRLQNLATKQKYHSCTILGTGVRILLIQTFILIGLKTLMRGLNHKSVGISRVVTSHQGSSHQWSLGGLGAQIFLSIIWNQGSEFSYYPVFSNDDNEYRERLVSRPYLIIDSHFWMSSGKGELFYTQYTKLRNSNKNFNFSWNHCEKTWLLPDIKSLFSNENKALFLSL